MKRLALIMILASSLTISKAQNDTQQWTGTWAASAEFTGNGDMPATSLSNRSLREVIHVSIGGETMRLQLSNEFGSSDVEIKSIYIANALDGSGIDVKSARWLTFGGKRAVTIEPGKTVFSDDIKYNLKPLQRLAVTINYGNKTPENATSHRGSRTTSYIIPGESKPKTVFTDPEKVDHWYNIAALDVITESETDVVVCLGNSITDGRGSTTNEQNRWTDRLAEALGGGVAVLNQGIGGNCVIEGGLSEPALKRFDRDVLSMRGINKLIIFEGVNDIGGSRDSERKAQQLIEAYETMIEKAHAKGIKVYLGTITPFKDSFYYSHFHEAARLTVNDWIRSNDKADGIIDFDELVRDPKDPQKLRKEFSDDWLHLTPAGYETMGKFAAEIIKR